MLDHREQSALGVLIGISALILAAHALLGMIGSAAFAQPWSPEAGEGTLVVIEGTLSSYHTLSGGHAAGRVDDAPIFLPADLADQVSLAEGDRIRIVGVAATYNGEKEIVVRSTADITIISAAPSPSRAVPG
ncbi:single stranded DNA-binding domain-containing protein [Methanofollis fontis]|uniref:Uncharacterized protein n=1 Tax=Methanofollis fontis TaxID=2052832 RepID=A0A483CV11_9EURY|nr:hypothetical protein [Methanofollis fontis]TAJ45476.1 hypothetical protein CUJ86_01740 [Methanofollis fontis]